MKGESLINRRIFKYPFQFEIKAYKSVEHNKCTILIRGPLVQEKVWISFSSVHGKTMLTCSVGAKDKYSDEKLLYPGI